MGFEVGLGWVSRWRSGSQFSFGIGVRVRMGFRDRFEFGIMVGFGDWG